MSATYSGTHPWQIFLCKWAIRIVLEGCFFVASNSETSPSTASSMTFKHPKKLHSEHRWTNQGWAPLQKETVSYRCVCVFTSSSCFWQRIITEVAHPPKLRMPYHLSKTSPDDYPCIPPSLFMDFPARITCESKPCVSAALTAAVMALSELLQVYHLLSLAPLVSEGHNSHRSTILASSTNNSCSANTGA